MQDDRSFEGKLERFETAISSAPSVADDVMRRVGQKPIPVRRRQWTRSPAPAVCAVAAACLVGVTIAAWIVASSPDSGSVVSNSGSQQTAAHQGGRHPHPSDKPAGDVPADQHPTSQTPEELSRAGDVQLDRDGAPQPHDDSVSTKPQIAISTQPAVSTQPGTADGETPAGCPSDGRAGEQHPGPDGVTPMGLPDKGYTDGYLGEGVGETNGDPEWDWDLKEPRDGLADGLTKPSAESRLSKSETIRLAAKCIRDSEPNLNRKMDAESAVARYYHKSEVYNGNSLWLVGFPDTGREVEKDGDGKSRQAVLYRMVWVQEDGSYSGNCLGELPPTKPSVRFGPQREAKAIQYAKDFVLRHYPKRVGRWLPTATFNTDNRSFGGGPLWIVGFEFREDPPAGLEVNGPPSVQAVWVTPDGAVMLGPAIRMGPTSVVPKDEAVVTEPEAAAPPGPAAEEEKKSEAKSKKAAWGDPTDAGNVVEVASNAVESEIADDGSSGSGEERAWGEAVDELQCRLHVEKTTLKAGQWPRLLVDVKNGGERELTLGETPDFWELQCGGTWYRAGVWFSGDCKMLELTPSKTHHRFPLALAEAWKWQEKDGEQPLAFTAGKHVLRVALRPAPKHAGPWPTFLSNAIEIEVLPDQPANGVRAEETKKREAPKSKRVSWGPAAEGVQCRLRAAKRSWQQGRIPDLSVDWRNKGTGNWEITLPRGNWELEIDGSRHEPSVREPRNQRVALEPGGRPRGLEVPVLSNGILGLVLHDLSPGKHTLRLVYMLNSPADTAETPLRVVSNPLEINVLPVDDDVAWGKPVEGVQCHLRVDHRSWRQGTVPKLFADLRNQSKRDLSIALESESWEFEIDGKWRKPSIYWSGVRRHLPLAAGRRQLNLEVWTNSTEGLDELTLGTHTLRVARILSSALKGPVNQRLRVVSNPIEIEILPNQLAGD